MFVRAQRDDHSRRFRWHRLRRLTPWLLFPLLLLAELLWIYRDWPAELLSGPQPIERGEVAPAIAQKGPAPDSSQQRRGGQAAPSSATQRATARTDSAPADRETARRRIDEAMARLTALSQRRDPYLSASEINQFHHQLASLSRQGMLAIPAIRRFLQKSADADLLAFHGGERLGFRTLRLALFDLLERIGGAEAEAVWHETLQGNRNPLEIAALAGYLEAQMPGRYRRLILESARSALLTASEDQQEPADLGPLFHVFQQYGDASLVSELEQVAPLQWGRYAAVALANLPDGVGVSSLARTVRQASESDLAGRFALKLLAQAADHPEARAALLESVRGQRVSDALWPELAELIAGAYRIQLEAPARQPQESAPISAVNELIAYTPGGGQRLYGVRYSTSYLTSEQLGQRLELLDAMLLEVANPIAIQALEHAYDRVWSLYLAEEQR